MPTHMNLQPYPFEFEIRQEPLEVTGFPYTPMKPDLNWTFTDANGHEHYVLRDSSGQGFDSWPTLMEYGWFDADDEEHSGHCCVECGYPIEPGLIRDLQRELHGGGFRQFVPGQIQYFIDGQEVSELDARRTFVKHGVRWPVLLNSPGRTPQRPSADREANPTG